ncbi:Gvp36p KNAG_0D01760 [Huiozyma naganishii CBS 8797]|uniref:BAR domain-containing protein n=1 Tax=Huiozyma naganishii (strain ATCC MYA-139 / BCRC 22969 / CBS 8797 / KCTC 17520 / NBRC 10181 / NCYC 3082 / Yp74L-3) TaxID=1071383 RepID=J7RXU4_HUIN7|nr:hypothetical protein KNAG_0D01760 [Kazachstania naganishii CBS 8797]CCK69927.1 hypothetical protein KNAG_0D01760 [Kazachstania naganishii CBS 8797]
MSSFNSFASSLNKTLYDFGSSVSQKTQEFSRDLPSLAQTTQRLVQEKLGQVTDISQLPQEYLELEKRVDALKLVHEHFLQVTAIYENESYDYPKYVRDSVNEWSRTVATRVSELRHVSSAAEAQHVIAAPTQETEPKTLHYALSKVALNGSQLVDNLDAPRTPRETQLSSGLLEFSGVEAELAQARLEQDAAVKAQFNEKLRGQLSGEIARAAAARKEVFQKRLQYDVARTNLLNAKPEKEASLRVQMETLEDEFAQCTEHATIVMQEVLSQADLLGAVRRLAAAQHAYHERSAAILEGFLGAAEASAATTATTAPDTSAADVSPDASTAGDTSTPIDLDDE